MKINLTQLKNKQDKNEVDLSNKTDKVLELSPTGDFTYSFKNIYDSDWIDSENEAISGATTQVENLELPEKAKYNISFNLNTPEIYLSFLNIELLSKPIDNQKVIGVGQFIYSNLREVLLTLYNWKGLTQGVDFLSSVYEITTGGALPGIPTPTIVAPPPTSCYTKTAYFTSIHFYEGSGATYDLTPDGLHVTPGGYSTLQLIQGWIAAYHPITGTIGVLWSFGQSVDFKHPPLYFPVPEASSLPCGSTTPPSGYPNQYWESQGQFTLQEYMDLTGKNYAQATAIFTSYYPELFITPIGLGPPYKAYKRETSDAVESAKEVLKIIKIDNNNFQINIYGYLLLVSPANVETDYSDPNFPTYKPESDPLSIRLKVYFKGHPVNFMQTKGYNK
jgi:hypothetical protein